MEVKKAWKKINKNFTQIFESEFLRIRIFSSFSHSIDNRRKKNKLYLLKIARNAHIAASRKREREREMNDRE